MMMSPPDDPRQLALPHTVLTLDDAAYARALELAAEAAAGHVRRERADNTTRAYHHHWRQWTEHCARRGVNASPVDPRELIVYLTSLSLGKRQAPNSVRLALSAISVVDQRLRVTQADRHPPAVRADPLVRAWHKGWSREHPRAPRRQAPAVSAPELERVIRAAQDRPRNVSGPAHVALYARDRAMLLIGVAAALRVSELVALELGDVVATERGLEVIVRQSKTDPEGRTRRAGVLPQGKTLRCPVDAWRTWARIRGDWPGAAFVAVDRAGELARAALDERSARKLLVRRAKAAGISLTSHFMRVSCITLAVQQGKSLVKIADHTGHKSLEMVRHYARQASLFDDDNPTSGLLDGE